MHVSQRKTKIPTCPEEGWLSDGRRVLHFKPVIWDRWQQELEVTHGEWRRIRRRLCSNDVNGSVVSRPWSYGVNAALRAGHRVRRNGSLRSLRGWCFCGEGNSQTNQSRRPWRARQCV